MGLNSVKRLTPLTADDIENGGMRESEKLDFKRQVNLDDDNGKERFLNDVVAFLNRGAARIIIGVDESNGQFSRFVPLAGNPDDEALRIQNVLERIKPIPLDIQAKPISVDDGFIIDLQIPEHFLRPYMNGMNGAYLIRKDVKNLPIDPALMRSRFVDQISFSSRLTELTDSEDARLAESGRMMMAPALRIGILPQDHFDHLKPAFNPDPVSTLTPVLPDRDRPPFVSCEDGHEAFETHSAPASDEKTGLNRLFVRDDWFVHATLVWVLQMNSAEGRLEIEEFERRLRHYMSELSKFFDGQKIDGPFAVTFALQGIDHNEIFQRWFRGLRTVRTLRPILVSSLADETYLEDFFTKVRRATMYG